ncbi:MAG TPA: hypothetical protein PKC97_15315 [Burkholderiaceae bacterium]|jgi:uncharacterized protein (DUF2147 family)|nr:hypothetical protein [Burkholderiaceae bacterium]
MIVRLAAAVALAASTLLAGAQSASAPAASAPALSALQGRWVRPDGGYTVTIDSVGADGQLIARYANPNPLPFSRAEARRDDSGLLVFLELRAGGYNGSSYTLRYNAARDALEGVYHQAPTQQNFAVRFLRDGR